MSQNSPKTTDEQEIDLTSISRGIGNAVQNFNSFLFRSIQFLIKNAIIITLLIILGVALGIYLDRTQKTYDHQLNITPNFGSTDYLYAKIDLLDAKISEGDTMFFKAIGVTDPTKLAGIKITPVVDVYRFVHNNEQNFELLRLMSEDNDIKKIVEEPTTSKNYPYHLIAFSTKDKTSRAKTIDPLMKYLNTSDFYTKMQREYVNNVRTKMTANAITLQQIDNVLNEFGAATEGGSKNPNLVYYNDNTQLNEVLKTKDELLKEQGNHRINMVSLDKIVKENDSIMNIENNKAVNGKMKLFLPLLFLMFFVLFTAFRTFYKGQKLRQSTENQ